MGPMEEVVDAVRKPIKQGLGVQAYRAFLMVGVIAIFWSQQHFVSKEIYSRDHDEIHRTLDEFKLILNTMEERDKVNDRQDRVLADHEARIRYLEQKCLMMK